MSLPVDAARLLGRLERFGVRLGLEAPRRLLAALGDPQASCPVVLVAGTNGKGSTAAWLAAMATAAGYRTGLYTSPHLESVSERIRLDGRCLDDGFLGERILAAGAAAAAALDAPPTYFELLTAVACDCFERRGADLAVLEVGLGGRLDAANAVEPALSLITQIGFDHERHLGDSLAAIAREKAGILRPGVPAWSSATAPAAVAALAAAAAERGTPLTFTSARTKIVPLSAGRVRIVTANGSHELEPALAGAHQLANLALATAAAEELAAGGFERLDSAAVAAGARGCRWPGRLEEVALPGGARVLLDSAHNPSATAALAAHLARLGGSWRVVFGSLRDKRAEESLALLLPVASSVVLTRPPGDRGLDPRDLVAGLRRDVAVVVEPDPEKAVDRALASVSAGSPDGGRPEVLICGSIYLVGAARQHLRRRFGVPPPAAEIVTAGRSRPGDAELP